VDQKNLVGGIEMVLKNQVAIVTGGGRNIGKAFSKALWNEGAVVIIADVDKAAAENTVAELGERAEFIKTDITNTAELDHLVNSVLSKYGRIDILVNNAGAQLNKKRLEEIEEKDFDLTMAINVKGMSLLTQKVVNGYMKEAGHGKIINTASICGNIFFDENFCYTVSKGAVKAFTGQVAVELAKYNINVNSISPGYINTEMNKDTFSKPGVMDEICRKIPMRRVAEVEELGGALVFLASDASNYVTGQTIIIDGGYTLV